jgi:predicted nuclease of predicted toxin-antitoxin system
LKILFDQGVPKPLQTHLPHHEVKRAFQLGWADKKNGELLALAENAGFEILVTTDQNLRYQQNLHGRKISVFILGRGNWPEIQPHVAQIAVEINAIKQPGVYFFAIDPLS